jgi:hypothetical protein
MPDPLKPEKHEIEIVVDPSGALSYSGKENIEVQPPDEIHWICNSHDYGIQFANNVSPFEKDVLSLSKKMRQPTDPCIVKKHGRGRLKFKYTVSVHIPGGAKPIVIDDPVIIVDDG